MIDQTVIETTFPIYNRIDKQARFHNGYRGDIAPLISPNNRIMSFQFKRSQRNLDTYKIHTSNSKAVFILNKLEGDAVISEVDLLSWFQDKHLIMNFANEAADYCIYRGTYLLDTPLTTGYYYLEISDGMNTWYGEVFHVFKCGEQSEGDFRVHGQSDDTRVYSTDNERSYN